MHLNWIPDYYLYVLLQQTITRIAFAQTASLQQLCKCIKRGIKGELRMHCLNTQLFIDHSLSNIEILLFYAFFTVPLTLKLVEGGGKIMIRD